MKKKTYISDNQRVGKNLLLCHPPQTTNFFSMISRPFSVWAETSRRPPFLRNARLALLLMPFLVLSMALPAQLISLSIWQTQRPEGKKSKKHDSIPSEADATHEVTVDHWGRVLSKKGLPTSITDQELVQINLQTCKKKENDYVLAYEGEWNDGVAVSPQKDKKMKSFKGDSCVVTLVRFAAIGPFNTDLTVRILDTKNDGKKVYERKITVRRKYFVFAGTGMNYSLLSSPENISIGLAPNGIDSTLYADDSEGRAVLSLNALFFPTGRMLSGRQKVKGGAIVGMRLDDEQFQGFFAGPAFYFSPGLTLIGGLHFARVKRVVDDRDFTFGRDEFTGDLADRVRKRWGADLFFGLNIDLNIFTKTLKQ